MQQDQQQTSGNQPEQSTPNVKQSKTAKYILGAFIILITFLCLVIIDNKKSNQPKIVYAPSTENTTAQNANKDSKVKWVFDHSVEVNFSGQYAEINYFETGMGMAFAGATEPYCITNADGKEFCGDKGEDISSKLPNSNANTKLKFKSQNDKDGKITVNLYRPE